MASKREAWLSLLPGDPRPALLASDEPFARLVTLTAVLRKPENDAEVRRARRATERPKQLFEAARTLLGAWRNRTREKPYMFGHGKRFVLGKWPPTWYDASAVLEALAPYPSVWMGRTASVEDRKSTAEIARALASTFGNDGMITPASCYRGFEEYSFGQRKRPSPWATARVCGLLRVFSAIADRRERLSTVDRTPRHARAMPDEEGAVVGS